ncbi:uncharacterized protein LOC131948540 [Physella acuta]|uniref:uncharacterized protein LOC131948540 n=1 Tax=Physella acuta TaxID=109671 RepID=UPI0027DEAA85|nr:uncharacterized protein LOC131948540 [Physella acuta]
MAVKETAPVGKTLLSLITWSRDDDVNFSVREIEGFSLTFAGAPDQVNDSEKFLQLTNVYNGDIALKVGLDFEAFPAGHKFLTAGVVVKDTSGLTGEATLRLDVLDDDDLPPLFYYPDCEEPCSPLYQASISPSHVGEIESITPGPIAAKDGDSLNYTVTFSLVDGPPNFEKCLTINSSTGQMYVIQALGQFYTQKEILVVVQATETSPLQHQTRTTLLLVVGEDPPTSGLTTLILLPITLVLLLLAVVCGLYWWMKNKRPFLHQIVPAIMTGTESTDQCISTVSEYSYIDTISVHDRRKQVSCSKLVEDWPAESSTQQTLHVMDHNSSNESSRPRPSGLDIYDQLETPASRDGSWSRQTSPAPSKFRLTVDPPQPSSSRSSPYSPLRDEDEGSSDSHRVQHNNRHAHHPLPVPLAVQEQRLSSIDFRLHHDARDGPRGEAPRSGDYAPDVYDATADYQELEVDAGFYTDVIKLKRQRHVTEIPLDTLEPRYWTTVEALDSAESDI